MMIFLDECCTFILVFSSNKCVEYFTNIPKFLCHEHNFLAHGPQLPTHGSFNKVAHSRHTFSLELRGPLCRKVKIEPKEVGSPPKVGVHDIFMVYGRSSLDKRRH